jgi:PAS domain S-box-containing protein
LTAGELALQHFNFLAESCNYDFPRDYETSLAMSVPARQSLKASIEERTAQLGAVNRELRKEIEVRRQAEERLRQGEERFRQMAESIREVFWMTDPAKNQTIYISPAYEAIWGRTCESLYASPRNWLEAIHPEDRPRVLEAALTKQVSGHYNEVYRILRPDGSVRWIQDRAFPIHDPSGKVYRVTGIAEDITERRLTEQRLAARHAVIRALAESATLGEGTAAILKSVCERLGWEVGALWEVDRQSEVLRCLDVWCVPNNAIQQFVNVTRAMTFASGMGLPGRVWAEGRAAWIPDVLADGNFLRAPIAAKCGLHGGFGFPILLRNEVIGVIEFFSGELREPDEPLLVMMSALGGQIGQFIARKQAEQALQQAEAKYRSIFENAIEGIFQITPEGRFLSANPALARMMGYGSPEELIAGIHDIASQAYVDPQNRLVLKRRLETDGFVRGFENEIYHKDGNRRWISINARAVRDVAGMVLYYEGTCEDITERKRAEARIATLAHAVESTAEMICITDLEDRFTFLNRAFQKAYGYTEAELAGKGPEILFSPQNPPSLMSEILKQTRAGGWRGEVIDRRKDGTEFPVFLTTSQIKDQTGRVIGLMGVAHDITERKRAEKQTIAFSTLGYKLSATTTRSEAAQIIMDIASELFGWDAGYVHLYSSAQDKIIPLLTVDRVGGQRVAVTAESFTPEPSLLMRRVMAEGGQLIDRRAKPSTVSDLVPFGDTARPSASMMYAPIHSNEAVQGILSIQSYTAGAYSPEDLKLLEALADYCGDALQRISVAEALRETEARYRSIFENATEGIFQTTRDGRYLNANPALARIFGYSSPAELIASVTNIARQTFVSAERARELKTLLAGQDFVLRFEAERYRKDRSKVWTSINVRSVRDGRGNLLYYEGTVQDVSERKAAESVLRDSERKLRLIAENTSDVIFAFDMERNPVYINPAVKDLTGYAAAEIQEKRFINWIHPADQERMLNHWEKLFAGQSHSEVEYRLLTKAGEMKWSSSTWGPLLDEAGRQIGVQGRERDITERKRLEAEVLEISANERRRLGHDLHDGLGQFLAGVALKTKTLEEELAAEGSSQTRRAKELVAHMNQAITQSRTLAHGLDPVHVEANGVVAALENLAAQAQDMFGIQCAFACRQERLAVSPQTGIALYRITQEAIHNAITHGQPQRIQVELALEGEQLRLRIQDNGKGFAPGGKPGSGIGLRIMQYRAGSIGGSLSVQSRPGSGTQVECLVPEQLGLTRL